VKCYDGCRCRPRWYGHRPKFDKLTVRVAFELKGFGDRRLNTNIGFYPEPIELYPRLPLAASTQLNVPFTRAQMSARGRPLPLQGPSAIGQLRAGRNRILGSGYFRISNLPTRQRRALSPARRQFQPHFSRLSSFNLDHCHPFPAPRTRSRR